MSIFRTIQRDAYLLSRASGDVAAAQRGPAVLAKRLVRRRLTRSAFSILRRAGLR